MILRHVLGQRPINPLAENSSLALRHVTWEERGRRRAVVGIELALTLLLVVGALLLPAAQFAVFGAIFLAIWWLTRQRKLSIDRSCALMAGLLGIGIYLRILVLFLAEQPKHPDYSLFFAIYAFVPAYFTLLAVLYPYPRSAKLAAAAWLYCALLTTALCLPYLLDGGPHQGLMPLMTTVWLCYPVFLLLLNYFSRLQVEMMQRYASATKTAELAQQASDESAAKLDALFHQASVGLALLSYQGAWLRVNEKLCQLVGYDEEALLRTNFQALNHPDDLNLDVELAEKLMRREINSYEVDKRFVRKDHSVIWVNLSVSLLAGLPGTEEFYISVIHDISSRIAAEAALSRLNHELESRIQQRTFELQLSNQRWQDRSSLLSRITELMGLLPSAQNEKETCGMATMYLPRIFPGSSGTLFLCTDEDRHLVTRA